MKNTKIASHKKLTKKISKTLRRASLFCVLFVTAFSVVNPVSASGSLKIMEGTTNFSASVNLQYEGETTGQGDTATISADGLTLFNAVPPLIVKVDSNPAMQGIKATASNAEILAFSSTMGAEFAFTYKTSGQTNPWGQVCQDMPADAITAFETAGLIWSGIIESSVPISISVCWSNLGSPNILGYSGGQPLNRDFPGAPQANTWYQGSLANALAGTDLLPLSYDDYITFNSMFSWYFKTDGNTSPGTYDLVSVALHEIGHGLNFSGSANYSAGKGSIGRGYPAYPTIFDKYVEDAGGTKVTSYPNLSTSLGSLLTSNNVWFNGAYANAANGGSRVKLFAPSNWSSGSSFSHLDYTSFSGTSNSLMVYSMASGSSQHSPGMVTQGILKDLGWESTPPTISGNVGSAGVTLNYTDGSIKSVTSDETGSYSFNVSSNWSGTVTPIKTGTIFSPENRSYTNINMSQVDQDYLASDAYQTISGNAGVAAATISFTDGTSQSVTADGNGAYSIDVSYGWSGTVTPAKVGFAFSAQSRDYNNVVHDIGSQDYSAMAVLETPQDVEASDGLFADKVSVTWTAIPGITTYRIYRAENQKSRRTLLGTIRSGVVYEDRQALPGVTYRYWIRACTGSVCGSFSRLNTGWRLSNIPTAIAPRDLIANTNPVYTWSKVAEASQYQFQVMQGTKVIYRLRIASSRCEKTTNCKIRPRTVLDYSTYTWKVRAMLNGSWMPFSAVESFTTTRE
ncbi:MAG: hypothetical protein ABIJ65_09540 [Chloroflexota bacterium]